MSDDRDRIKERVNKAFPVEEYGTYVRATVIDLILEETKDLRIAQKGNLARLDDLNALVKGIWEILGIPSSLYHLEIAEGIHLLDFIRKLKSDRDAWRDMMAPLLIYGQEHGQRIGIKPGQSIPEKLLEILKEYESIRTTS